LCLRQRHCTASCVNARFILFLLSFSPRVGFVCFEKHKQEKKIHKIPILLRRKEDVGGSRIRARKTVAVPCCPPDLALSPDIAERATVTEQGAGLWVEWHSSAEPHSQLLIPDTCRFPMFFGVEENFAFVVRANSSFGPDSYLYTPF